MADAVSTSLLERLRITAHDSLDSVTDALLPEVTEQVASYFKTRGELAATDQRAYEAFVRAQDEVAAALAEHMAAAADSGRRAILPDPGFVVRAATAAVALRIAEAGGDGDQRAFEPLFVNIVTHQAVQRPVIPSPDDKPPTPVDEQQGWSAELGVQVPLLVGAPHIITPSTITEGRQQRQRSYVVDVLVNPWVVREALKHHAFQAQVVELAFEWLEEEAGLGARPDVPCAVLPAALCPYWDPEGGEMGKPRLFVLDEAVTRQQLAPAERPERSLQHPRSLLTAMRRASAAAEPAATLLRPAAASTFKEAKTPLVREHRPPTRRIRIAIDEHDDDEAEPTLANALVFKRGFLLA